MRRVHEKMIMVTGIRSNYFKRSIQVIVAIAVLLIASYFWLKRQIHDVIMPPTRTLPIGDREQIQVDPATHRLTIITEKGPRTVTLPDRMSTIDVRSNGMVDIISPQFGWERHFFISFVGADVFKVGAGMDGFYWKRLDGGLGGGASRGALA